MYPKVIVAASVASAADRTVLISAASIDLLGCSATAGTSLSAAGTGTRKTAASGVLRCDGSAVPQCCAGGSACSMRPEAHVLPTGGKVANGPRTRGGNEHKTGSWRMCVHEVCDTDLRRRRRFPAQRQCRSGYIRNASAGRQGRCLQASSASRSDANTSSLGHRGDAIPICA